MTINALDMRVNISDIRLIIYIGAPFDLIKYAQQSGREGHNRYLC